MRCKQLCLALFSAAVLTLLPTLRAAEQKCDKIDDLPNCSYTATNGSCKLVLDRMNPVTPSTIYVRRHGCVGVRVVNSSPLEDLSLDWKSSTVVLPPDTFQTLLTSVTGAGNLGKATFNFPVSEESREYVAATPPQKCAQCTWNDLRARQDSLQKTLEDLDPVAQAKMPISDLKLVLQLSAVGTPDRNVPWLHGPTWKHWLDGIVQGLKSAAEYPTGDKFVKEITKASKDLSALNKDLQFFKDHANQEEQGQSTLLGARQDQLDATYKYVTGSAAVLPARLNALREALEKLPASGEGLPADNSVITDRSDNEERAYESQAWTVNYANKLTPTLKRIAADTYKTENAVALTALNDTPNKTSLTTITVQFQSPSRIEVSTGIMVPIKPYRTFTKAAIATNGVVTDNIVQENKTYAVVPMAFVNVLTKEWIANRQRSAFFLTGGVGYNPASSMVEFATGFTFSYRSIAVSALADIGRDNRLGGGFHVGQSLGLGNAATPITSTYWSVKPGLALSVRIPLGGGSK